jgi:hypothetical protein
VPSAGPTRVCNKVYNRAYNRIYNLVKCCCSMCSRRFARLGVLLLKSAIKALCGTWRCFGAWWHQWQNFQPPRSDATTAVIPKASGLITAQLAVWSYVDTRALSSPACGAGGTVKQKGVVAAVLAVLGTGSVLSGAASLEKVLNAGIAAVCYSGTCSIALL